MLHFERNYWYVYVLKNTKSNWVYVGLHNHQGNKAYSHSSSSVLLQEAIDSGNISEHIVWKGVVKEKAHALETYLINFAKKYGFNLYNNNSGGGYAGGARTKILTAEDYAVGEDLIAHNIYPEKEVGIIPTMNASEINLRLRSLADEVRDAVVNYLDGKPGLAVSYEPLETVIDMPFLQIRENAIDKENVDKVVESMRIDMIKAERLVEAVSVVVYPNGDMLRIDGTTTTYAIKEVNKWATVPVVFLDSAMFDDNLIYMETYATLRNRPEKHKGANNPKKEMKARIKNFHDQNKVLFDNSIESFQQKFMELYKGAYSDRSMLANISVYIREHNEKNNRGDNWFDYSVDEGRLMDNLVRNIRAKFDKSECTKIAVSALEREGVANPMNYFGNIAPGGKNTSVILAYHTSTATEDKEDYHYERLGSALAEAGFKLDKKKAKYGYPPFVSQITGKKIFVIFLPCRMDTKKAINVKTIMGKLFDDDIDEAA